MAIEDEISRMMTIREVAELLHVHTNTLRRWADSNLIPSYRIGNRGDRRFARDDVNQFLKDLKTHNTNHFQSGWDHGLVKQQ